MRISDWSSDVCSSDLEKNRSRRRCFLSILWGLSPQIAIKPSSNTAVHQTNPQEFTMQHTMQNLMLAYARAANATSLRASSRHPKERRRAAQLFSSAMETHSKRDFIRHTSEERRVGKEGVSTCRSRW